MKLVYLDMDGVIADFVTGVARLFGQPEKGMYGQNPPREWELGPHFGCSGNEVYRRLAQASEAFWAGLEPTWAFDRLTGILADQYVTVLTAITKSPSCASGKLQWLERYLREPVILTSAPKALLAQPYTLLIDDKEQNVDEFAAAGGKALLWPAPWNRERADFPGCELAYERLGELLA